MRTKSNIPSLDVEVVNPDQLEKNPAGVAGKQLPVLAVPAATLGDRDGVHVVVDREGDLNGKVHDEHTLGAELVGQNLDGVGNQKTRPGKRVGDTVQPDKDNIDVANANDTFQCVLLTSDSGANQEDKHTTGAIRSQSIVESSECETLTQRGKAGVYQYGRPTKRMR